MAIVNVKVFGGFAANRPMNKPHVAVDPRHRWCGGSCSVAVCSKRCRSKYSDSPRAGRRNKLGSSLANYPFLCGFPLLDFPFPLTYPINESPKGGHLIRKGCSQTTDLSLVAAALLYGSS